MDGVKYMLVKYRVQHYKDGNGRDYFTPQRKVPFLPIWLNCRYNNSQHSIMEFEELSSALKWVSDITEYELFQANANKRIPQKSL